MTKLLTDVTSAVSPTFESASWLASGTGQGTSTTAETRRLESRRYNGPALSVKDFRTVCDYILVPEPTAVKTGDQFLLARPPGFGVRRQRDGHCVVSLRETFMLRLHLPQPTSINVPLNSSRLLRRRCQPRPIEYRLMATKQFLGVFMALFKTALATWHPGRAGAVAPPKLAPK